MTAQHAAALRAREKRGEEGKKRQESNRTEVAARVGVVRLQRERGGELIARGAQVAQRVQRAAEQLAAARVAVGARRARAVVLARGQQAAVGLLRDAQVDVHLGYQLVVLWRPRVLRAVPYLSYLHVTLAHSICRIW